MSKKITINSCEFEFKIPNIKFDKNNNLDKMKTTFKIITCKEEIDENEKFCKKHKQNFCNHELEETKDLDFDCDPELDIYHTTIKEEYNYKCEKCDYFKRHYENYKYEKAINLGDLRYFLANNWNEFEILKYKIDQYLKMEIEDE